MLLHLSGELLDCWQLLLLVLREVLVIYVLMWPFSVVVLIIAYLLMLGVKSGEAGEEEKLAVQE